MPSIQANGLKFHVQTLGDGPPVAMIHGMFLGNIASWYFGAAPILARRHEVFLYDLRSHGKTERSPTGYDLTTMTADLDALLRDWDRGAVDLVGHSYGALVALRFALDHPDRVRRVVAVEAPYPPQRFEQAERILRIDPEKLMTYTDPAEVKAAMKEAGYDAEDLIDKFLPPGMKGALLGSRRRLRSFVRTLHYLLAETSIKQDIRAESSLTDETVGQIRAPVLCVYGSRSNCRPAADDLLRLLPDTRLHEIDCGHYLTLEKPAELAAAIEGFL